MENNNFPKLPGISDNDEDKGNGSHKDQPPKTMFGGLHVKEVFEALGKPNNFQTAQSSVRGTAMPALLTMHFSKIPTKDLIDSLLKQKEIKRAKRNSLITYESKLGLFAKQFPFLPTDPDLIKAYLLPFAGETVRHRRNHYYLLMMLYKHAVKRFGLGKNPMMEIERPLVNTQATQTLSLNQVRLLLTTPETLREKVALQMLVGHGWQQIEVGRITAGDIAGISHDLIRCHGKEREEMTPILPETAALLKELAADLKPNERVFRVQQTNHGVKSPQGEEGISPLIKHLYQRANLTPLKGHNLRRTFTTLVIEASGDQDIAMHLIRDKKLSLADRCLRYPPAKLVSAIFKYSPLRLAAAE